MKTLPALLLLLLAASAVATAIQRDATQAAGGVAAVEAGGAHTCALTESGRVQCWGWNFYGQLGDGTTASRLVPTIACASGVGSGCAPLEDIAAISNGAHHTCALTAGGGVLCWGLNEDGQLGDGTTADRALPAAACETLAPCAPLEDIEAISGGTAHTCALTSASTVRCWGANGHGQLGDATTKSSPVPVDVCASAPPCTPLSGIAALSSGSAHTCALTKGAQLRCWGSNESGQLGDGGVCGVVCASPQTVCAAAGAPACAPLRDIAAIRAGGDHTCALSSAGTVLCWGGNDSGQLGDGTQIARSKPVAVLEGAIAVTTGIRYTCAVDAHGGASCWGLNSVSQLGDGSTNDSALPAPVAGLASGLSAIDAGGSHTCALRATGTIACWGLNGDGRLGDGTFTLRATPVQVVGLGPKATPTPPPAATGDANCDGRVTAVDAALILQLVAGLIAALPCPAAADVNADGAVTAVDAALVLQRVAGLLPAVLSFETR